MDTHVNKEIGDCKFYRTKSCDSEIMSTEGNGKNSKRQMESPEHLNQDNKLLKTARNLDLPPESERFQNKNLSHSAPILANLDERDRTMLDLFKQMIAVQFSEFSTTYIKPLTQQVHDWKEENERLKHDMKVCFDRIESLEKVIREANLVFTNVPNTSDYEKSIEDLCRGQMRTGGNIEVESAIPIKKNLAKNTVTLLASFRSRKTAEAVIKQSRNLKGTEIGVSRDLSKAERQARNALLVLRRKILDTGTTSKVKVYGNVMMIDREKLKLQNDAFGNDKVDGVLFVREKFDINVNDVFVNTNQ